MEEVFKSIIEHGANNIPLENEECCICYEKAEHTIKCMHNVCENCLFKINKCPLCRKEIIIFKLHGYFKINDVLSDVPEQLDGLILKRQQIVTPLGARLTDYEIAYPSKKHLWPDLMKYINS